MKNKGFTLIEAMIALAIIAILMAIFIPSYVDFKCDTGRSECTVKQSERGLGVDAEQLNAIIRTELPRCPSEMLCVVDVPEGVCYYFNVGYESAGLSCMHLIYKPRSN